MVASASSRSARRRLPWWYGRIGLIGVRVDREPHDPELATEAFGAFQALVDSVVVLQRDGFLRNDDTVLVARYIWSVVHGVAMLAIDGQLPEQDVEELTRYALERMRIGIVATPPKK